MSLMPFYNHGSLSGDRYKMYKKTWDAGQKIGRWAKRKWDQKKSREEKTDKRRTRSKNQAPVMGVQIPSSGGESRSLTVIKNPKLSLGVAKDLLGVNSVNRTFSGTSTALVGLQNVVLMGAYCDVGDIQNAFTNIAQTAVGTNSSKLAYLSVHSNVFITNSSSINNHVDIYDVVSRQDGSDTNLTPVAVLTAGGVDAVNGVATDYTVPGYTPYENTRFTSAYKIYKRTPIILSPGQTHVHSVVYKINKVFAKERIVTSDLAGPIGGITYFTFAFFHGTPVHDAATEAVVTTGQTKLDFVQLESLKYQGMLFNYASNSIVNGLSTTMVGPEQFAENNPLDTADVV